MCTRPFLGHAYPMVPLAGALRDLGHDVSFATAAAFLPELQRLGWPTIAAGIDPRSAPPAPVWSAQVSSAQVSSALVSSALADEPAGYGTEVLLSKVSDILAESRRSRVDAIVHEPTDLAAVFAAEVLDIPQVTLGRSQFLTPEHWAGYVGPALARARRRLGLVPDPSLDRLFGSCYLDTVPAWFQPPGLLLPESRVEIRAELFDGPAGGDAVGAAWASTASDGVYVTFGTVYNQNTTVMREALRAVADLGRDVLLTVGPGRSGRAAELSAGQPAHVTVAPYVAQSSVLGRCTLVVCHGGYSTVLGAISAGVPLVVCPQGSDHAANARQCERLGVGVAIAPEDFSAEACRRAAERVLGDPSYLDRAGQLAARIAAAPPVSFGAHLIEHLPDLYRAGFDVAGRAISRSA